MTGAALGVILIELSEIIVSWKETIWDDFWKKKEIHCWQKTEDMIKYPSRQQNDNKILTQKCLKKLEKSAWQRKRDVIK